MLLKAIGLLSLFVMGLGFQAKPVLAEGIRRAAKHPRRAETRARQVNQHDRIQQGVRSGELTKDEAQTLRKEQKDVRETKREALSDDGKIDRAEMKEIRNDQNAASQHIYEEKHDSEER